MIALTFDTDWCPVYMIYPIMEALEAAKVKSTWFFTGPYPQIEEMRRKPQLYELGIHPNFRPGSTHGDTVSSVFEHCLSFLPEAKVMRSHGLLVSTDIYIEAMKYGLKVDSSCFLQGKCDNSHRFSFGTRGIRVCPIYWMDQVELSKNTCDEGGIYRVDIGPYILYSPNTYVVCFHPVYLWYNIRSLAQDWRVFVRENRPPLSGYGIRAYFDQYLYNMVRQGKTVAPFLSEI